MSKVASVKPAYLSGLVKGRWPVFVAVGLVLVVSIVLLIVVPLLSNDGTTVQVHNDSVKQEEQADLEDAGFFDAPWKIALVVGGVVTLFVIVVVVVIKLKPAKPITSPSPVIHSPATPTSTTTGTVTTVMSTGPVPIASIMPVPITTPTVAIPSNPPTTGMPPPIITPQPFPKPKDPNTSSTKIFKLINNNNENSYKRIAALVALAKLGSAWMSQQFPLLVPLATLGQFNVVQDVVVFDPAVKGTQTKSWTWVAKNMNEKQNSAITLFLDSFCQFAFNSSEFKDIGRVLDEQCAANGLQNVVDLKTAQAFLRNFKLQ